MSAKPKNARPADPEAAAPTGEPGYDAWLHREIQEGLADLDAGCATPAAKVWSDIGIE